MGMGQVRIGAVAACRCGWNNDGVLNAQDFFDFLNCFFAGCA